MGRPLIDLTGMQFGKLIVKYKSDRKAKNGSYYWVCKCDCGNITEVDSSNLKKNKVRSCGKCKIYNTYEEKDGYMIGYQNNGKYFYFDKEDFEKIKQYNWSINGSGYVINTSAKYKNKIGLAMHRLIMDAPDNMVVDHINHICYDNRKANLRICTQRQNNINKEVKGYTKRKNDKYEVSIRNNGKIMYLGRFDTKEEAIKAREEAFDEDHKIYSYKKEII